MSNVLNFKNWLRVNESSRLFEQTPAGSTISPAAQAQIDKLIAATSEPINSFISTNKITFETPGEPMMVNQATLSSAKDSPDLVLKLDTSFANDLYFTLIAPNKVGNDLEVVIGPSQSKGIIDRANVYKAIMYNVGQSGKTTFDKYVTGMRKATELEAAGKPNPLDQIVNLLLMISKKWKSGSMTTK